MPTTVFTGGEIWDGRPGSAPIHALAVRDGRILAVDSLARRLGDIADEVIDLHGGLLMPSFGDGHAHPIFGGLEETGPALRECRSIAQIQDSVRLWADAHPDSEWIVGGGYDATLAPDGLFDAAWLDVAVSDRPVVLRAWDYHTAWCNTEALRRAGIDADTPEPAAGEIVRRSDRTPLGILREAPAVDLVLAHAPRPGPADLLAALARAEQRYAACGVTWVQDAWVDEDLVDTYLDRAGRTGPLRLNLALRADPDRWSGQRQAFQDIRAQLHRRGDAITCRTVKFFADGILENRTAALLDPYADDPCTRGMPVWKPPQLAEAVAQADAAGFQVHIHAIGDAAIRAALDAIEHTEHHNGPRDRRPVIAHVQVLQPEDLPRIKRLGAVANFQPLWAAMDPVMEQLTLPRLGLDRGTRQYLIKSVLDSGASVSFGSDWPVSDLHPLRGLAVAATRQPLAAQAPTWLPDQRVHIEAGLAAYTSGVAHQAFEEHLWGRIAVGMHADLVWLDRDPRSRDPHTTAEVRVLGTWSKGSRTHDGT